MSLFLAKIQNKSETTKHHSEKKYKIAVCQDRYHDTSDTIKFFYYLKIIEYIMLAAKEMVKMATIMTMKKRSKAARKRSRVLR